MEVRLMRYISWWCGFRVGEVCVASSTKSGTPSKIINGNNYDSDNKEHVAAFDTSENSHMIDNLVRPFPDNNSSTKTINKRYNERVAMKEHKVVSKHFVDSFPMEQLPVAHDWRDYQGRNWLTAVFNQHSPRYCGSCWLHAAVSSMSDRLNIQRHGMASPIRLSRQFVLNCAGPKIGNCRGGSDNAVYGFAQEVGIPDESCMEYFAEESECRPFNQCRSCDPFPELLHGKNSEHDVKGALPNEGRKNTTHSIATETIKAEHPPDTNICYPVQTYDRFFVSDYGAMLQPSIDEMKKEIYRRGPISCAIDASIVEGDKNPYFEPSIIAEVRGVYGIQGEWNLDHDVVVVGFGTGTGFDGIRAHDIDVFKKALMNRITDKSRNVDTHNVQKDTSLDKIPYDYWIVKNSWGTFWGEDGYMRVLAGFNVMGIEEECSWATMNPKPVRKAYGPPDWMYLFPTGHHIISGDGTNSTEEKRKDSRNIRATGNASVSTNSATESKRDMNSVHSSQSSGTDEV